MTAAGLALLHSARPVTLNAVIYRAAAALPYNDRERATAGLRGQLLLIAVAADAVPDWSTLTVEGPVEAVGLHGRTWYEWTATVTASSVTYDLTDAVLDVMVQPARRSAQTVAGDDTAPQATHSA